MHIEELTKEASLEFLARSHLGRLACTNESQPYVTPFHYVYHDHCIYSFGTVGQKIEWLRANPLACVEVDEIENPQQWTSVVVFGVYEEIPATPDERPTRQYIHDLLQQRQLWWEPGFAQTIIHHTPRPLTPVYFRLKVKEITGHRATRD